MSEFKITCYIGQKSLDQAIELYRRRYPERSEDSFTVTFVPYYLIPDDSAHGVPWAERVATKNGQERVNKVRTEIQRIGRARGIQFGYESKIGKTRDSHRLVQYAPPESRKALLEQIFKVHLEEDADITFHPHLTAAAVAAGFDAAEVAAFLASGDLGREVDELDAKARRDGVRSLPTVDINGVRVEGAQDVPEFMDSIVRARQGICELNTNPWERWDRWGVPY